MTALRASHWLGALFGAVVVVGMLHPPLLAATPAPLRSPPSAVPGSHAGNAKIAKVAKGLAVLACAWRAWR